MDVELPNGYVIQGVPEGTSKQDIMAKAIKAGVATEADFGSAKAPPAKPEMSTGEQILANPVARIAKGAIADPILGVSQLVANTGLVGEDAKRMVNNIVNQYETATQEARRKGGDTGLDLYQFAGAILSPANKVAGAVGALGKGSAIARTALTGGAIGAAAPVANTEDFWSTKGIQTGLGAALGPLASGAVQAAGKVGGMFSGLTEAGRNTALYKTIQEGSGEAFDAVKAALAKAEQLVPGSKPTAAETIANIPQAKQLAAEQAKLAGKKEFAGQFATREAENEAARQAALKTISGTPAEQEALTAARKELFPTYGAPALEANDSVRLAFNNIEKAVMGKVPKLIQSADELQAGQQAEFEAIMKGSGVVPKPVSTKDTITEAAKQRMAQVKAYQRESLAETGVFPLEVGSLVDKLNSALRGTRSDEARKVIEGVKNDLVSKADNNGFLSSVDLYENVRKVMNQNINRYLNQGQQPMQGGIPQQAAAAGDNVKKLIDAELNKSSNGLWGKYLEEYATHSKKLDRMAVGSVLEQKLGTSFGNPERAGAFTTAVENVTSTLKKATGIPRYDKLEQVLTADEIKTINSIKADLARQGKAESLAKGVTDLENAIPTPGKGINALNQAVTLAKSVVSYLEKGSQKEFDRKMAQMMMNPQEMATFLQTFPTSKVDNVVSAMMKKMSPDTRRAFIQQFTIEPVANQATNSGIPRIELTGMAQ